MALKSLSRNFIQITYLPNGDISQFYVRYAAEDTDPSIGRYEYSEVVNVDDALTLAQRNVLAAIAQVLETNARGRARPNAT